MAKIECALYRVCPAYVVVLCIVLAYVVSHLGYVYEAMLPCQTRLRLTEQAVDRVLTGALRPCCGCPSQAEALASPTCTAGCASGMFKGFSGPWIQAVYSSARMFVPFATQATGRAWMT